LESWSKQLKYDGFFTLYSGFPLFSSVGTFIFALSVMFAQMTG